MSAPASQAATAASTVGVMNTSVSSCQILYRPIRGRSTSFLMAAIWSGEFALRPTAPPQAADFAILTTKSME